MNVPAEAVADVLHHHLRHASLAIGVSYLIMLLVRRHPILILLWAILLGLGVSIGVGLIFGVLPARKASRLDPIECLRYE